MKLLLQNTASGLKPLYDDDYDQKKRLKLGKVYEAVIKSPRNLEFHRKYFGLINCAWEYQNEKTQAHFRDSAELFRKTVQIAAGHCDTVYSIERREWIEQAKSVAFDKMDEVEFEDLYSKVLDVLLHIFLKHVSREEFERELINFL